MRWNHGFSLIRLPSLRQRSWQRKARGFSLIELMVVVSIMAITFGVIITTYRAAQRSSRDAKRQADLRTIQGGLQQYYADQNNFPIALNLATATTFSYNSRVYLKNIPQDPVAGQSYCYASAVSQADTTTCSDATKCQNYLLYAKLENPPSGAPTYTCGSPAANYNFQLTPP